MEKQKQGSADDGIDDEIDEGSPNKKAIVEEDDDGITDFYGDSFKESVHSKAKAESGVLDADNDGPAEEEGLDDYNDDDSDFDNMDLNYSQTHLDSFL